MKIFNKSAEMHKLCWLDYSNYQRFAVVSTFLVRNGEKELQTLLGPEQAKYFKDIMAQNAKRLAEQISYKKRDIAEMEKQLAMYNDHANKLKELY